MNYSLGMTRSGVVSAESKKTDADAKDLCLFYLYCFYFIRWSITPTPSIFRMEVMDAAMVMGIFEDAGA